MTRVSMVAEQLALDGSIDFVVYYDNGSIKMFRDYPTEEQLAS